jgi:hypothetical protein
MVSPDTRRVLLLLAILIAALAAVVHAAATAPTQLAPWWFRRFEAELTRWDSAPGDAPRP